MSPCRSRFLVRNFDLVWSEPTRTLAMRLGISDVGLAKSCRRADLLLPPRGYWAKLAAGKTVRKPQLPARDPGMSDQILLGRDRWSWGQALREVDEIRAYASAVRDRQVTLDDRLSETAFQDWGGLGAEPGRSNRPSPLRQLQDRSD